MWAVRPGSLGQYRCRQLCDTVSTFDQQFIHRQLPPPMKISSLALTLALLPAALISTSVRAVAGPGPTEVQGVVEVLNDVLYKPYSRSVLTEEGSLPWASFD